MSETRDQRIAELRLNLEAEIKQLNGLFRMRDLLGSGPSTTPQERPPNVALRELQPAEARWRLDEKVASEAPRILRNIEMTARELAELLQN